MQKLLSILSPRGRWLKWLASVFALMLLAVGISFLIDYLQPERVLVTIGKETTYITGPLKANGYPDYVTAINQLNREGVTKENNVFVPILEVVGPLNIAQDSQRSYYAQLGMKPLPRDTEYLQKYSDYVEKLLKEKFPVSAIGGEGSVQAAPAAPFVADNEPIPDYIKEEPGFDEKKFRAEQKAVIDAQKFRDQLSDEIFLTRPWTAKDHPEAAEWLAKQEPLLAKLNEITARKKFFAPCERSENNDQLSGSLLMHIDIVRAAANCISARANFEIGNGQRDLALKDIRILFHLASSLHHGSAGLVDQLVGNSIERIAEKSMNYLAQDPAITLDELNSLEQDYKNISPMNVAKSVDTHERLMYLSGICYIAEVGNEKATSGKRRPRTASFFMRNRLNYDIILRDGNETYDRITKIFQIADRDQRVNAWEEYYNEANRRGLMDQTEFLMKVDSFFSTKTGRSKQTSRIMKALLTKPIGAMNLVDQKQNMIHEIHQAGFALARYRLKHKKYPVDFAELKSEGIAKIPNDMYANGQCIYSCDGNGFILYSIGGDLTDSGGFNGDDPNAIMDEHDDIAVFSLNRVPQAPPKPVEPMSDGPNPDEPAPMTGDSAPLPAPTDNSEPSKELPKEEAK